MENSIYLYSNIRFLRRSKGWTGEELGKMSNYTRQSINRIEQGLMDIPVSRMLRFAEIFSCSLDELVFQDLRQYREEQDM